MVTHRSAKNKGSQMEYSVRDSLLPKYSDILLTKEEGYVSQYDLISHQYKIKIEVKKHKGFTWNELKKYFYKLQGRAPLDYTPYVIFQGNRQPCLIMLWHEGKLIVAEFESALHVPYIIHGAKK